MPQYQTRTGPLFVDVPTFSPEMVHGWQPASPRLFESRPHLGWTDAQVTHVPAPLDQQMMAGQKPDRPRLPFAAQQGWRWYPLEFIAAVTPFSIEMVLHGYPDAARLPFHPGLGWTDAQTTPVEAPFTPSMSQGQGPDLPRRPFVAQVGWQVMLPDTITAAAAGWAIEQSLRAFPERPVLPRLDHQGKTETWFLAFNVQYNVEAIIRFLPFVS